MTNEAVHKIKILVIDDDTLIRCAICSALKKLNYETIEAPTGKEGIREFKKSLPDIVITDIMMPDKNGLVAILEIRAAKPDVKIIAISSGGKTNDGSFLEIACELGAVATISKPFTFDDIKNALDTVAAL